MLHIVPNTPVTAAEPPQVECGMTTHDILPLLFNNFKPLYLGKYTFAQGMVLMRNVLESIECVFHSYVIKMTKITADVKPK